MFSDREALSKIEALFSEKNRTPFDEDYASVIDALSFSKTHLDDTEPAELKKAWTNFLRKTFEADTPWEWPCNVGLAEWYAMQGRAYHAIAVYEHLLREVHKRGLDRSEREYCGEFQHWLQMLFQLCKHEGLTERAFHVAELIGDFYEEGLIDAPEYAEVIISLPPLRRRKVNQNIDSERCEADRRYREYFGDLVNKLHPLTARCLIQAEFMSTPSGRKIDPSSAPLWWSLAVESEFHHKVYERNRQRLDGILENKRPKPGQFCGIGQIDFAIITTTSDRLRKSIIEAEIPAWRELLTVPNVIAIFELLRKHRNRIAHAGHSGPYTLVQCNEFIKRIRDSGWIINFLSSLQAPTSR